MSMARFSPHTVSTIIDNIFPLRQSQLKVFCLLITGMCLARKGIMTEMARKVPGPKILRSRAKRFWRFAANPRFKPETLMANWAKWVIRTFCKGSVLLIAIDWTDFPGDNNILMAAIPFAGRAIPLYWEFHKYENIPDSQNLIEHRFVSKLLGFIPAGYRIKVVADRGFGRAEFVQFLKDQHIDLVLRVKSNVYINTKRRKILLRDYILKPNIPVVFKNITYREDGVVSGVTVVGIVYAGFDDPWWLITNLTSEQAIREYEKRFDIEEWFRDLKHELDIDTIRTKHKKPIVFSACVSYGLLMTLGKLAKKYPSWVKQVVTNNAYSLIFLALRFIAGLIPNRAFYYRWVRVIAIPDG